MALQITNKTSLLWLVIRGVQILFALLLFILGIVSTSKIGFSTGYPAMAIVSGLFSLIFYVLVIVPQVLKFISPALSLGGEIFTFIWWLIAFAAAANLFGGATCSFHYYIFYTSTSWEVACRSGKAIIAFGVLGWVLSGVTLGLLIYHSIVPVAKLLAWYSRDFFVVGGIVPKNIPTDPASAAAADPEAVVGERSEESADETKTAADSGLDPYVESDPNTATPAAVAVEPKPVADEGLALDPAVNSRA